MFMHNLFTFGWWRHILGVEQSIIFCGSKFFRILGCSTSLWGFDWLFSISGSKVMAKYG